MRGEVMSKHCPSDVLYRQAKQYRLWVDMLCPISNSGKELVLSNDAVEGLANFMRDQEALMMKIGNALSELPYFEVELQGVDI